MNTAQQVIIVVIIATLLFKAIALAEILRNEFKGNDKLMWVLIVLLMPLVGWLFYFLSSNKNIIEKEEEVPIKPKESVIVSNIAVNKLGDLYYFVYNGTEYYYEDFHAAENSIQTIAATGNVSVRNLIKSKPA